MILRTNISNRSGVFEAAWVVALFATRRGLTKGSFSCVHHFLDCFVQQRSVYEWTRRSTHRASRARCSGLSKTSMFGADGSGAAFWRVHALVAARGERLDAVGEDDTRSPSENTDWHANSELVPLSTIYIYICCMTGVAQPSLHNTAVESRNDAKSKRLYLALPVRQKTKKQKKNGNIHTHSVHGHLGVASLGWHKLAKVSR